MVHRGHQQKVQAEQAVHLVVMAQVELMVQRAQQELLALVVHRQKVHREVVVHQERLALTEQAEVVEAAVHLVHLVHRA